MTDVEYAKEKVRVQELMDWWIGVLGLKRWTMDVVFHRSEMGGENVATCEAKWQYLEAVIHFDLMKTSELSGENLEYTVVHELMHIFLNEMRGNKGVTKHEERVASELAWAFVWTKDKGRKKECLNPI